MWMPICTIDLVTRKPVTDILHFVNATPVHLYSKRQGTMERQHFGSELVATRNAVDQIIEFEKSHSFMYLGVPAANRKSYMFWRQQGCCGQCKVFQH